MMLTVGNHVRFLPTAIMGDLENFPFIHTVLDTDSEPARMHGRGLLLEDAMELARALDKHERGVGPQPWGY